MQTSAGYGYVQSDRQGTWLGNIIGPRRFGAVHPDRDGVNLVVERGQPHVSKGQRGGIPFDIYISEAYLEQLTTWSALRVVTTEPNIRVHAVKADIWAALESDSYVSLAVAWLDLHDAGDRAATEAIDAFARRA